GRLVTRQHVVDVVGSERERDLRELGPVSEPVHLHGWDIRRRESCNRNALHVVVTGGGTERVECGWKRVDRTDRGELLLEIGGGDEELRAGIRRGFVNRQPNLCVPGRDQRIEDL